MQVIDPHSFTDFDRNERQLQEALMFAIVVAGKRADQQAIKLDKLNRDIEWYVRTELKEALYQMFKIRPADMPSLTPLGGYWDIAFTCNDMTRLRKIVEGTKIGQYDRIIRCFGNLASRLPSMEEGNYTFLRAEERMIDLRTVDARTLEGVHGIGPKTARFFILHTRPNANVACLDTHILRYMREELKIATPRATPQGLRYLELERAFLAHAKSLGRDPAQLDLEIWNRYTKSDMSVAKALISA